jgi:hypothetical protein
LRSVNFCPENSNQKLSFTLIFDRKYKKKSIFVVKKKYRRFSNNADSKSAVLDIVWFVIRTKLPKFLEILWFLKGKTKIFAKHLTKSGLWKLI